MEEKPNYYSIIPAEVRYDTDLKDKAKLLYGEITSLSDKNGYCYATNKYFAELYEVSTTTISLLINNLVNKGYVEREIIYKEGTKEILNRYLRIVKGGYLRNFKEGYLKKVKDNNTSINNTSNNKKEIYKEKFKPPTLEEVEEYCKSRNNNINPQKFFDYYNVSNWKDKDGKQVKNWKQKVITWERGKNEEQKKEQPQWFGKEIEQQEISKEEQQELENILKNF